MAKNPGTTLIFFSSLDGCKIERPVPEHKFHPERKWRFDYAWLEQKVALEVEGGTFIQGRHSRGAGMGKDMEKYNTAAVMGWRIIRVVPAALCNTSTMNLLKSILITNN